jgi:hypothetical protein
VPGCSLIIIGNCPRLGGGLSQEALLFLSLGIVLVLCHKNVTNPSCPSWNPKVTTGQRDLAKEMGTKWKQGCQAFLLYLVNLWAQERSQYFLAKADSKFLLQVLGWET